MPKSNKKTLSIAKKINIPQLDKELVAYHPNNLDGGSALQIKDWVDGFTGFIGVIDARKIRARHPIFPEDSN